MQIWNGCNVLNIAGNPIKDTNAKIIFLSSASKVERWLTPLPHPMVYKAFTLDHTIISVPDFTEVRWVLFVGCGMDDPPVLTSSGNVGNSTLHWCLQICHKPFLHQLRAIWKCSCTIFSIVNARTCIDLIFSNLPEINAYALVNTWSTHHTLVVSVPTWLLLICLHIWQMIC